MPDRSIKVSEAVWKAIAEQGKFGETEDDVLRRVFGLSPERETGCSSPHKRHVGRGTPRYSTKPLSARVQRGMLVVEFKADEVSEQWVLPDRSDKEEIRRVRDQAVDFALKHGASHPGQTNAVKKVLTAAGFWLTK